MIKCMNSQTEILNNILAEMKKVDGKEETSEKVWALAATIVDRFFALLFFIVVLLVNLVLYVFQLTNLHWKKIGPWVCQSIHINNGQCSCNVIGGSRGRSRSASPLRVLIRTNFTKCSSVVSDLQGWHPAMGNPGSASECGVLPVVETLCKQI